MSSGTTSLMELDMAKARMSFTELTHHVVQTAAAALAVAAIVERVAAITPIMEVVQRILGDDPLRPFQG